MVTVAAVGGACIGEGASDAATVGSRCTVLGSGDQVGGVVFNTKGSNQMGVVVANTLVAAGVGAWWSRVTAVVVAHSSTRGKGSGG